MKLIGLLTFCLCVVVLQVSSKPYSSQDEDEELAQSELEKQEVSYIISRQIFGNEATIDAKKPTKVKKVSPKLMIDMDEDLLDDLEDDNEQGMELQRATTYTNPIVPLEFRDSAKKKPKKKNLNKRRLMKKIGSDFDPEWMSSEMPASSSGEMVASVATVSEDQMAELEKQVADLDLANKMKQLVDIDGDSPAVSKMVDVFEQWLVKKSSCPVTYTWTDIGEYFWPRFVKQGKCSDNTDSKSLKNDDYDENEDDTQGVAPSRGCSWPEGMKCVQGEAKILHILRWHCRRRKKTTSSQSQTSSRSSNNSNKRRKCKWYKVPYPVVSSCKCSCH